MNYLFILFIFSSIYLFQLKEGLVISWNVVNGQFTDPNSWLGGVVPSSSDIGNIGNGGTCGITSTANINIINLSSNSKMNMYQDFVVYNLNINTGGVFTAYNGFLNASYIVVNASSTLDIQVKEGARSIIGLELHATTFFRGTGTETLFLGEVNSYSGSTITLLNLYRVNNNAYPVYYAGSTLNLISTSMNINGFPTFASNSIINLNNSSMLSYNGDLYSTISMTNGSSFTVIKTNCIINTQSFQVTDSLLNISSSASVTGSTQLTLLNSVLQGDLISLFGSSILTITDSGSNYPSTNSFTATFNDNSYSEMVNSKLSASFILNNSSNVNIKSSSLLTSDSISVNGHSIFNVQNATLTISKQFSSIDSTIVTFTGAYCNILGSADSVVMETVNLISSTIRATDAPVTLKYFVGSGSNLLVTSSNFTSSSMVLKSLSYGLLDQGSLFNIAQSKLTDSLLNIFTSVSPSNSIGDTTLVSNSSLIVDGSIFSFTSSLVNDSVFTITNSIITTTSSTTFDLNSMLNCTHSTFSTNGNKLNFLNGSVATFTDSTLFFNNPSSTTSINNFINNITLSLSNIKANYSSVIFGNIDILNGNNEFDHCIVEITKLTSTGSNFTLKDSSTTSNIGGALSFSSSILSLLNSPFDVIDLELVDSELNVKLTHSFTAGQFKSTNGNNSFINSDIYATDLFLISSRVDLDNSKFDVIQSINILNSQTQLSLTNSSITTMNLINNGQISLDSSSNIDINGFYQEVSNDSQLYLSIGSFVNPFIRITGSATFKGSLIGAIDFNLLNTTSLLRFPLISYTSSSGNINQHIIYSIDYENGELQTQINQFCNVNLERSNNLLSLLVSNCNLKNPTVEPCKGTPKCGGTSNGICTSKGCQCISPWTGPDCTSKQIIINPPPGTNTTDPSSNINSTTQNGSDGTDISFLSSIGLVELRELDYKENIIQRYPFSKWTYTNQSTSSQIKSLYKTSIIKPNQLLQTNISVIIQWFTKTTEIPFAGITLTMSPSTLKYNIEISKYPFSSLLNRLELVLSASTQLSTNEEQICSQQEFGNEQSSNNTYQYLKIQMNSQSLYGRFINRAVLDNRNVQIDNQLITSNKSSNNEAQIGILIPSYNNLAILDPDFSVLIDTKSAETKPDSICQDKSISKSSNKLSKSQIAGIIIGAVGFVGVAIVVTTYFIIKNKRDKKLMNDLIRKGIN